VSTYSRLGHLVFIVVVTVIAAAVLNATRQGETPVLIGETPTAETAACHSSAEALVACLVLRAGTRCNGRRAGAIVGFGGAALYTEVRLRRVDARLDAIAEEEIPAIVGVAAIRHDLLELRGSIERALLIQSVSPSIVTRQIEDGRADLQRYAQENDGHHDDETRQALDAVEETLSAITLVRDELARRDTIGARLRV
jgi:hypothetical protein